MSMVCGNALWILVNGSCGHEGLRVEKLPVQTYSRPHRHSKSVGTEVLAAGAKISRDLTTTIFIVATRGPNSHGRRWKDLYMSKEKVIIAGGERKCCCVISELT